MTAPATVLCAGAQTHFPGNGVPIILFSLVEEGGAVGWGQVTKCEKLQEKLNTTELHT